MNGLPKRHPFWAKLKYKDDDRSTGTIVEWHPLLAHSADVAAVTEAKFWLNPVVLERNRGFSGHELRPISNHPDILTMATFEITIDDEKIQDLLQSDRDMAVLLDARTPLSRCFVAFPPP